MKQRLNLLQVCRGFAAISVILFHLRDTSKTYFGIIAFNNIFSHGFIGVDFFFVLSGFIITYVHYSDIVNQSNPFGFLKKRFVRIYPTYWAMATITLIVLVVVLHGKSLHLDHYMNIRSFTEWLYIIGCYLLLPLKNQYFLELAWTLSYEVIFYLLFFIAIIIGFKRARVLLIIWLLLIFGQGFLYNFHGIFIPKVLNSINIEFISGCMVAYLFKKSYRIPKLISYIVLISVPLAYSIATYAYNIDLTKTDLNVFLLAGFNGILLYNVVVIDTYKKINCSKILLLIGEASYSIYLSHTFFLGAFGRIFSKLVSESHTTNGLALQSTLFVIFLLTVIGGIIFYKYVETPLTKYSKMLVLKHDKVSATS